MLTSVACELKVRRAELLEWPIKEFDDEVRAINRKFGYFLASIAETQGAKFPKGNPHPTWMFDKAKDEFAGLISMDALSAAHHTSFTQEEQTPINNPLH